MSIGVLLVSQTGIAREILDNARMTFAECPLQARAMEVDSNGDTDWPALIFGVLETLDQGDGVLTLVDLCGSTASNVVMEAASKAGNRVAVVTGLNLPMLVKVLNYPDKPLREMQDLAVQGGRDGVRILK